jgi:uncharacterized protein YjbI with pentapeptide repeats
MVEDLEGGAVLTEIPASEILDKIQRGKLVDYDRVTIKGDLDISKLDLQKEGEKLCVDSLIIINNSQINGAVVFRGTIFRQAISFVSTQFCGNADFWAATFSELATFQSVTFSGNADFSVAKFIREANFSSAKFIREANFQAATFRGEALFKRSRFDDIVDFNARFCNRLDLSESKIYSMRLSKASFENASIISLVFCDFSRLEVRWDSIRDKIEYDGSAYLALVKNFNNLELFDDADECYYHYRTVRRKEQLRWIMPKLLDYVACMAYGYGVRPRNPLILSLVLFLIYIPIFMSGFGLHDPLGSIVNATYLSVLVFTSSPKTDPLTGLYGIVGMLERIAGWLLMACFLVALAKKTLR